MQVLHEIDDIAIHMTLDIDKKCARLTLPLDTCDSDTILFGNYSSAPSKYSRDCISGPNIEVHYAWSCHSLLDSRHNRQHETNGHPRT